MFRIIVDIQQHSNFTQIKRTFLVSVKALVKLMQNQNLELWLSSHQNLL